jgi:hypothetical protein
LWLCRLPFAVFNPGLADCYVPAPAADDPKKQVDEKLFNRSEGFKSRRPKQIQTGDFPTTTIGSFPQTPGESPQTCAMQGEGQKSQCPFREAEL